jgi:hypothetical protein
VGLVPSQIKYYLPDSINVGKYSQVKYLCALKLIDGRKDTPRFTVIQGELPQQMIVFRTDFIETVLTTERQMAVGV